MEVVVYSVEGLCVLGRDRRKRIFREGTSDHLVGSTEGFKSREERRSSSKDKLVTECVINSDGDRSRLIGPVLETQCLVSVIVQYPRVTVESNGVRSV